MSSVGQLFVYGNIWVSLCASALTWLTYLEFGIAPSIEVLLFVFFSTLVIYCMNMISGLKSLEEKGTSSERHHWCLANSVALKVLAVIGIFGAVWCSLLLGFESWMVLAPFALAAVMYVIPLIGKRGSGVRLREFGLNKIFTIAIVWAVVTFVLPLVNINGFAVLSDTHVLLKGVARATFIFAITLPFDIRDLQNDMKIDVKTIPMILGVRKTVILSVSILALYGLIYVFFSEVTLIGAGHLVGALLTMGLVMLTNLKRGDMFYSFVLEGTMIILALSVYGVLLLR